MGTCKCGFSTDPENNCNGTHKVVKAVKEDIISKVEAIDIHAAENNSLNALGMKMIVLDILRGKR